MAKIKVYRASGSPVEPAALAAYEQDWKATFDKVQEKCGLDMLRMHKLLARIEKLLIKKHGQELEVELPKTAKAWNDLITRFTGTPLALAQRADGKGLVLIVADQGLG